MSERKINLEEIEALLKDFPNLDYPKNCGNGLYEISKGIFTGKKGLKQFNRELKKLITNK